MAKIEPYKLKINGPHEEAPRLWKSNPDGDPEYPWYSRKGEDGEILYSIPLEAPTEIPADDSADARKYTYSWLPLFGGKRMRVFWAETSSREWAFDQKRWLDAEAKRSERRSKREVPVAEMLGDGTDDGNRKKEWKLLDDAGDTTGEDPEPDEAEELSADADQDDDGTEAQSEDEPESAVRKLSYEPYRFPPTESQALTRIELDTVRKYIEDKQPRSWRAFCLKEWCGVEAREIAAELEVDPSRVYQLVDAVHRLALRFREETK